MKTFVFGLTVSKFEGLRHLVMSSQPFRTSGWPGSKARWTYSKFMKFEEKNWSIQVVGVIGVDVKDDITADLGPIAVCEQGRGV